MAPKIPPRRITGGAPNARVSVRLLAFLSVAAAIALPPSAHPAGGPSIVFQAPDHATVGAPIELQLRVVGATDVAGYEARLLYDTRAAHLTQVTSRGTQGAKAGRDLRDLGPVERRDGYVFGAYSCFGSDCSGHGATTRAVGGDVVVARIDVRADRPGPLQLRLSDIRVVDSTGAYVPVASDETATIQVSGAGTAATHAAPSTAPMAHGKSKGRSIRDATGDRRVDVSDVTEAALQWVVARASDVTCGTDFPQVLDVNRDGCLDIADVQALAGSGSSTGGSAKSIGASWSAAANPPFVVNSTGDGDDAAAGDGVCRTSGGTCTLRAAIEESNAQAGANEIDFAIGTGLQTIQLASSMPTISDTTGGLLIDGYTQPGAAVNTAPLADNAQIKIQIRGTGATGPNGPSITSANNTLRGLSFYNIRRSIYIYGHGATNDSVIGCFVGTDAGGTFASSTSDTYASGIAIEAGAHGNFVGTTALADRNVISGNARHGIVTYNEGSNDNVFYNNIVGLSPSGQARLPNLKHGMDINAGSSNNIVGGTGTNQHNVFSGNGLLNDPDGPAGIEISHATTTTGNQVIGNYFGTDLTGTTAASWTWNGVWGIHLEDGVNHSLISDNVVVNSKGGAIKVQDSGTTANQFTDNQVGVTANGSAGPNNGYGVMVANGATGNEIGPGNVIENGPVGVWIKDATTDGNTITQNSISNNSGLGIDLDPASQVNLNDAGDLDTGANQQLNFPEIGSATAGTVTGTACGGCTVEVYRADSNGPGTEGGPGAGAYGEGETLLATTVANSAGSFSAGVTAANGQWVTATATDSAGNTSEFSENVQVVANATVPSAPSLTVSARSTEDVLSWTAPTSNGGSSVSAYRIYRGTTAGGETLLAQVGDALNYNDVEVAPGTSYWYRISAVNGVGESPLSNEVSATPTGTGIIVDDHFDRTVSTGWGTPDTGGGPWNVSNTARTKVGGSEGVVYGMSGNQDVQTWEASPRADMEILALVHLGANPAGGNYQARVMARAQGDPRNGYGARITHTTAGAALWVLSRTDNAGGTGSLSLANGTLASSGAAGTSWWIRLRVQGTRIQAKYWADGTTEPSAWTADVTDSYWSTGNASFGVFTQSGLTSSPSVGVASFSAVDLNGSSSATVPGPPSLTSSTGGDGSVALQWSPPSSNGGSTITNYRIYRATVSGGESFLAQTGNVTSYTDSTVTNGTTYYYEVTAVNGVGEGPFSNEGSATPQAGSTSTVMVQDAFARTVSSGWGTADVGGTWSVSSTSRTQVANGEGVIYGWNGGNQDVQAWNPATATDMEILALVHLSSSNPTGANYQARVVARAQSDTRNGYAARLVHTTSGAVTWSLGVVQNAGGTGTSTLASGTLASSGGAGTKWWIRLRVQGTNIDVKYWRDGTTEPASWLAAKTNSVYSSGRAAAGVYVNPNITSPFPSVGFGSFEADSLG